MKKPISRNIAIVSAVFMTVFSIMLITNYFQVSSTDTIRSEMIENLKLTNEETGGNPQLQEQIRELDLLARKAYFTNLYRLKTGVVILLTITAIFVVSLRMYYAKMRNIPEKVIDPIDVWAIQSKIRKYMVWIACGLAAAGIIFALFTSPFLLNLTQKAVKKSEIVVSDLSDNNVNSVGFDNTPIDTIEQNNDTLTTLEISKVTHNGFRGNNSFGISAAKNIPTSWNLVSKKNILWKVKVPRRGYNSPVINGNKLFFSGGDENTRELFCYELSSGKPLWKLAAKTISGSPSNALKVTDDTGWAASTVATNGEHVCAIFATGDVLCADMDGHQLWAKNIGIPDNPYGYASSLLIFGNFLIIQYDNRNIKKVIALEVATGKQRWVKERSEKHPSWSSPVIATVNHKPQLILMGNPGVTSYNPNNGEEYWRVECMAGEPVAGAASTQGIIFAATEYATITAINATDGTILWEKDEFLPEVASPVATQDFVFIATSYGVVASYHSQNGELIKSMELNTEFNSSPIIVEGKIYLISTDGKVFIFSAKRDFTLINSFETGEKTYATPAFTDKKMVIKTEESIYCVASDS